MSTRPVIFSSAVSTELHSARDLVAKTLISLGYDPKWQDIAATETGDLRGVLRKWIDGSDAVLQIVGHCYGFEPKEADPQFGLCSYTQYEAHYARMRGKPVYYILTEDGHPTDGCGCEPKTLHFLQEQYRQIVKSYGDMYHSTSSLMQTELLVHRLKDELAELRKRGKQHAVLVLGLLVVLVITTGWLTRGLWQQTKATTETKAAVTQLQDQATQTDQKMTSLLQRYKQMEQALIKLADTEMHAQQFGGEKLSPEQLRQRAYTLLENELGIAAGTLAKELPAFALELYSRPDTTLLMRARAAYALNKFEEAEKLFLESEAQDKKAMENAEKVAADLREQRIEALFGAGQSARVQLHYAQAMEHFQAAAALTSKERDVLQWIAVQDFICGIYILQGHFQEALAQSRQVWQTARQAAHDEALVVLMAHANYASALAGNGNAAEAESEYRALLQDLVRVFGAEHPFTLANRNNLAVVLKAQGRHAEAEQEQRAGLQIRERVLGAAHPDTLASRNNLANALDAQAKYAEAEREHRAVL